jgi:hypothetical protein
VLVFNYKTPFSVVRSRYLRNAIRPNGSFSCEYPNLVRSLYLLEVPRCIRMRRRWNWSSVPISTHKRMVSQSRITRSWRTCHGLACWTSEVVVANFDRVCYRRLLECSLMKYFMDVSVNRPCIGTMLEGDKCWGLND